MDSLCWVHLRLVERAVRHRSEERVAKAEARWAVRWNAATVKHDNTEQSSVDFSRVYDTRDTF